MRKFIIFISLSFTEILVLGLIIKHNSQLPCEGMCLDIGMDIKYYQNPLINGFRVISDNIYTMLVFILFTFLLTLLIDYLWKKISKK